ncbi:flagellar protein FlaG [Undibacterium squillarum]|uniref:flagellar protein FlaG n=1 Tax=Undibacterium squillarum TaxID=1131567 RepID=UPI0035AEAFBE
MDIRSIGSAPQSGPQISSKQVTSDAANIKVNFASSAAEISKEKDASAQKSPDLKQVNQAVSDINKTIQALSQDLQFSVDKDSNRVVVKIIDQQTNKVLRQIPSEEALEISKSLGKLQGLLIKQEA